MFTRFSRNALAPQGLTVWWGEVISRKSIVFYKEESRVTSSEWLVSATAKIVKLLRSLFFIPHSWFCRWVPFLLCFFCCYTQESFRPKCFVDMWVEIAAGCSVFRYSVRLVSQEIMSQRLLTWRSCFADSAPARVLKVTKPTGWKKKNINIRWKVL